MSAAILAALVAGLAAVERKAFLQAQLSRPIVVAPLIGWVLGDPLAGLYIGAPLELIWIGAANLGAALPPHETAATAAIAGAAVAAGDSVVPGATAALALVVFGPVAVIGRRLEAVGERANERLVTDAITALHEGHPRQAFRLHLTGLWRPFLASAALVFCAVAFVGPLLGRLAAVLSETMLGGLALGWALLWAVGGAAAVRAARLPRAVGLAAAGAASAAALWVAAASFGWAGVLG